MPQKPACWTFWRGNFAWKSNEENSSEQGDLLSVMPQMDTLRDRSVLMLRKETKKREGLVLQEADGAPGGIRTPDGLILKDLRWANCKFE